jgi:hypothetical protein
MFSTAAGRLSLRPPVQSVFDAGQKVSREYSTGCRALSDRVVDVTPTFDGIDMAIYGGQVCAHRYDGNVAPASLAPRGDIAGPPVVAASVLLDGFEAESIDVPSELDKFGFNLRLDLDGLGLGPASKQKSVPQPCRPVECGLAGAAQPDRDLPFRSGQDPGSRRYGDRSPRIR